MDRRTDIGGGIHLLHQPDDLGKEIVPGDLHPQIKAVGEDHIKQQTGGHAHKHHKTQVVILPEIIPQQGEWDHSQLHKPDCIGYDEILTERNPVVHHTVDDIPGLHQLFHQEKAQQIKRHIGQCDGDGMLPVKILDPAPPVPGAHRSYLPWTAPAITGSPQLPPQLLQEPEQPSSEPGK